MRKVIWTPTARKSLYQTLNFIRELWDESVVDEFLNQLDFRIEQLKSNPELAALFKGSEFRQLFIHENVSLFYRKNPEHIKLLLVWDNRQDPALLLQKINEANQS